MPRDRQLFNLRQSFYRLSCYVRRVSDAFYPVGAVSVGVETSDDGGGGDNAFTAGGVSHLRI